MDVHEHRRQDEETQLQIGGMTCASCVRRVEKALSKTPGVTSANVNFATHQATVSHDGNVAHEQLEKAVADAGYSAKADIHGHHTPSEHAEHLRQETAS